MILQRRRLLFKVVFPMGIVVLLALLSATSAFANHCYVADKPDGAGTHVTVNPDGSADGVSEAGNSGNLIVQGAFVDVSAFGVTQEVFIRGQSIDAGVQGVGTLPEQPLGAGSQDHGVQG